MQNGELLHYLLKFGAEKEQAVMFIQIIEAGWRSQENPLVPVKVLNDVRADSPNTRLKLSKGSIDLYSQFSFNGELLGRGIQMPHDQQILKSANLKQSKT
jgi:hypothetical protein